MNKIEKNKKILIGISIGMIVLGVLMLAGGIVLTVFGCKDITKSSGIIKLVFGILLILLSLGVEFYSIPMLITGGALRATQGSIAEGNLAKGTVNMRKCQICGSEIAENEPFCPNCGKSTSQEKTCSNCGAKMGADQKFCPSCGREQE